MTSISEQQLFRSLRTHQRSSDQLKILKDQSAQTTTREMEVVYRTISLFIYICIHIYIYIYTYIYIIYIYICKYIIYT